MRDGRQRRVQAAMYGVAVGRVGEHGAIASGDETRMEGDTSAQLIVSPRSLARIRPRHAPDRPCLWPRPAGLALTLVPRSANPDVVREAMRTVVLALVVAAPPERPEVERGWGLGGIASGEGTAAEAVLEVRVAVA